MSGPVPGTPSLLRAINDRAALRVLLDRGPLTRPEIGTLTGLSKPTASQLLARLQEAGLVVLDGVREGLPGRTAEVYRINPAAAYVGALDVTPGRIEARVADITGTVVGEHTLPTPRRPGGELVERLSAALEGASPPDRLRQVVIGVQAALDPSTGALGYATAKDMPGWQIPGLVPALAEGLGVPVAVENDVNLAALAEQAHGAALGHPDFVLLWADEGIGAAVVLGGRMHRGATGGAGEVGYMPTPGAPTAREAGRYANHGYQALTGGPAVLRLLRSYGVRGADFRQAVANAVRAAESAARGGGDARRAEDARAGLRDIAARLAVGLAAITSVLDPGLIVLAGGMVLAGGEPLRELVEHELHALTIPRPRLRLSSVEGNPVLAGALDLALDLARAEVFGFTPDTVRAATTPA
ncbi:ROK family transcriptional regulator [Nonomuraea sp. SMC257]|uniref:ROK family transcriptional regulator n=1 Tax=Nonomuraea montanisoli TaxID=2741721 RepID=A0A7Y6I788_9ACTN|nr:ROK family transcriptional regulator [Nonomuraea montanisoli]NUW32050.1 ROK family transcriptional regulator [Nonomuraea montanisoli]